MEEIKAFIAWNIPAIGIGLILYFYIKRLFLKQVQLPKHIWTLVYPNDKNSPKIMGLSDNSHLIFYPKYSTPYVHILDEKCKFVSVVEGTVFDKVTEKIYTKGDKIKIYPESNCVPYTKGQEAYLRVCIDECSVSLEDACGY